MGDDKSKKDKVHGDHVDENNSKKNGVHSHHIDDDKSEMHEMKHPHVDDEYYKNLIDPEIPIDCPKEMGAAFEDCKMPWGWDCCVKSPQIDFTDFTQASDSDSNTDLSQYKDPLGCTEEYGSRFKDCEREWGWDCCFVDDEALFNEYDDAVIIVDDDLSINDDAVSIDPNVADTEDPYTAGGKIDSTDFEVKSSGSKNPLGCSELYDSNEVYDCKREWGWDCCVAGNEFLGKQNDNSWEVNQIDLSQDDDGNILGVLLVIVMIGYVVYSLSMRFCGRRCTHEEHIESVKLYAKNKVLIPEDNYDDCDDDEDIELRPLVS